MCSRWKEAYTDDAYDPGGPTNLGITLADLAAYRAVPISNDTSDQLKAQVAALTPSEVAPIYRTRYWTPSFAPSLPPALALFHFDTAVNHGLSASARMLQQSLNVDADGEIGPLTLAAAAASPSTTCIDRYADVRRARYRALPTFWRFGRGWLARVDATQVAAKSLSLLVQSPNAKKETSMTVTSAQTSSTQVAPSPATNPGTPKWWGQSLTIWGTIVTTLATVLPIVGPLIGIEISADVVRQLGEGVVHVSQAAAGVIGIVMTIYGRTRAVQPLVRRDFMVKV